VAPAEKIAISKPLVSAVAASSTVIFWPFHSMTFPADLADAKNLTFDAGKFLSTSYVCITLPTMPVAPTIPIETFLFELLFVTNLGYLSNQPPMAWINSVCRNHFYLIFAGCHYFKSSLF